MFNTKLWEGKNVTKLSSKFSFRSRKIIFSNFTLKGAFQFRSMFVFASILFRNKLDTRKGKKRNGTEPGNFIIKMVSLNLRNDRKTKEKMMIFFPFFFFFIRIGGDNL